MERAPERRPSRLVSVVDRPPGYREGALTARPRGQRAASTTVCGMRILVCGWLGSTNLGDELVFAGVHGMLAGHQVAAVSIDPDVTRREHGVAAIDHRRLDLIARAARQADLVILGGGGLVQDETSPLNLPYHLSRVGLAHLGGTPWIGLALGVGPLTTPLGHRLAATLRGAKAITVRDAPSAQLLSSLGVRAELAADAAFNLSPPNPHVDLEAAGDRARDGAGRDVIAVSLRPWSGGARSMVPVGWRRQADEPAWFVPTVARTLERASTASGLPVRFIALQTDRDQHLHARIAASMATPTEQVVPTRRTVLADLARSRLIVAMRYHAGIGATIAQRPSVLIGYSSKVDALAATLGDAAAHLPFDREALATLDRAILQQLGSASAVTAVQEAAGNLRALAQANVMTLERFLH